MHHRLFLVTNDDKGILDNNVEILAGQLLSQFFEMLLQRCGSVGGRSEFFATRFAANRSSVAFDFIGTRWVRRVDSRIRTFCRQRIGIRPADPTKQQQPQDRNSGNRDHGMDIHQLTPECDRDCPEHVTRLGPLRRRSIV